MVGSLPHAVATTGRPLGRKDRGAAFFVIRGTEVVGVINLAVGEAWLADGGCYATCLAWFIDPKIRWTLLGGRAAALLLDQAKAWARAKGAAELFVHGTHGPSRGLARRGTDMGTNLVVEL